MTTLSRFLFTWKEEPSIKSSSLYLGGISLGWIILDYRTNLYQPRSTLEEIDRLFVEKQLPSPEEAKRYLEARIEAWLKLAFSKEEEEENG